MNGSSGDNGKPTKQISRGTKLSRATRILIGLTFVAILIYACVMKLREIRLSFSKLTNR